MRDLIYALCAVIASFCLLAALPAIAEQTTGVFDRVFVDSASDSALDLAGGIAQGGAVLVSASGDLRDDFVGRPELKTATGETCMLIDGDVSINDWAWFPALDGPAAVTWGNGTSTAPVLSVDVAEPVWTSLGTLPAAGISVPQGVAALSGSLYILREPSAGLWRLDDITDPSTATNVGTLPFQGQAITAVGSSLYIVAPTPRTLWRLDDITDPSTATNVGTLPALLASARGMAYDGSSLYIAESGSRALWRLDNLSDPSTAVEVGRLPLFADSTGGMTFLDAVLYGVEIGTRVQSFWSLTDLTDPASAVETGVQTPNSPPSATGLTASGGTLYAVSGDQMVYTPTEGSAACISWVYVDASDNPRAYAAVDGAGRIVAWWASEDPSADPAISAVSDWQGRTYAPTPVGMPPDDILTGLYAGEPVAALRAVLAARGWPANDGLTVASLVDGVPRSGCGTPDGDCRPMARLLALRALAEQRGETVFSLVRRATRIAPDGTWSLAP